MTLNDNQVETIFAAYRGVMVLRTMCKRADLKLGQQTAETILRELAMVFPEFPPRTALRERTLSP